MSDISPTTFFKNLPLSSPLDKPFVVTNTVTSCFNLTLGLIRPDFYNKDPIFLGTIRGPVTEVSNLNVHYYQFKFVSLGILVMSIAVLLEFQNRPASI